MISEELTHLFMQLLQPVQRKIWYAVNLTDDFYPPLNMAIQLNNLHYQAVMLATGIMLKKGDQITISLRHLEFLKVAMQENMTIRVTRAFLQNKNHYFISIDHPTHSTPAKQIRADPRVIIRRGGTQLDHCSTLLLNHLMAEIVDEEEVAEEDEPQVDCQIIPVDNNVDNEPMLVDEEVQQVEEEDEGEQLQP
jgi:hypothetical protein